MWELYLPGIGLIGFAMFLLQFFRDPEREIGQGITAPADGVVKGIEDVLLDTSTGKMISGGGGEKKGGKGKGMKTKIHSPQVNPI